MLQFHQSLITNIKTLLENAKTQVVQTVNSTMVYTYFEIGRLIVEDERQGKEKAEYGAETLKSLSRELMVEFGKGFSVRGLERMRSFYLIWSKSSTVLTKSSSRNELQPKEGKSLTLSWSHYVRLMSLKDGSERDFYETEAINNHWSIRELDRQNRFENK